MLGNIRSQLTRRTMLASGAALIAAPAFAEDCHLGPPPHEKAAKVWMDMDQTELDAAYDQAFYAPLARLNLARRAANSELTRKRLGEPKRMAYGPSEVEKLDVFKTSKPNAPIFVFIHGGAWLGGAAKNYADCAEMFLNAGAN
jgi:arylformamidase